MKKFKTRGNIICRFEGHAVKRLKTNFFIFAATIVMLMVLPVLFSCTSSGQEKSLSFGDSGKTVTLSPGDVFSVTLESNQTTGYSWKLSENMDQNVLLMTSSVYEVPKSDKDKVGAGGTETFSFKAKSQGKTSILLEYVRPWEEGVEPAQTFTLNIEVK